MNSRWLAIVLAGLLTVLMVPTPAAADVHWEFQLSVDPPQNPNDPFVAHVVVSLVGSYPGFVMPQPAVTRFLLTATGPDGMEHELIGTPAGPAIASDSAPGGSSRVNASYVPDQNGDWTFNLWQLDGGNKQLVVQRRVHTDKARLPFTSDAGARLVSAVHTDPAQPIVGQPAMIIVEFGAEARAAGITQVPLSVVDESGMQPLGMVSMGPTGTASVTWVPRQATAAGLLQAGDQIVPLVVVDAPASPPPADDPDAAPATDDEGAE